MSCLELRTSSHNYYLFLSPVQLYSAIYSTNTPPGNLIYLGKDVQLKNIVAEGWTNTTWIVEEGVRMTGSASTARNVALMSGGFYIKGREFEGGKSGN